MSDSAGELPGPAPPLGKVAGRYLIQGRLARGGMGEVFVAQDTATGRRVALKRLNDRTIDSPHIEHLFQLEYQTLRQLQHPHIIEVYDYGVDEGGPYYTMELLDGHDLHRLAPLPFKLVCRYLRDVAASLALLHTRGIAHRDLSPKNVRVTSDGHCKLIDFGAMAHFGAPTEPAGTPPVVAPEVVRGVPIDHRVDLYALGALAYWLLTGHHAYRAERIVQLPEVWRTPPKPIHTLVQDVPQRLEHLVMRLIDLDPGVRPPSVGYVIEELTTVASLEPDDSLDDARAFVAVPTLVGRGPEMGRLQRALAATAQAEGRALLIESNPGVGRTRLLNELAVQAQLSGTLLSHVDAGRHRDPHETARAILRGALRNTPDAVRESLDLSVLGHLLPELVPPGRPLSPLPSEPEQSALSLQLAFVDCCKRLSRARPLVLLVDDVHRADTASIALLSALAVETAQLSVLLVCTEERSAVLAAGGGLEALNARCRHLQLQPMGEQETSGLLRAMFGDVPNIAGLGRWMHAVSLGNPGHNIELAFHLVEHGVLRYLDGRWLVPAQLPEMELPHDLAESLRLRARQVSVASRALAEHLALLHGPAPLPLCVMLGGGQKATVEALEELSGLGIVIRNESGYVFTRELLRQVISEGIEDGRRRALHLAIGKALQSAFGAELVDEVRAGLHLIWGGEEERGADMLVRRVERMASQLHDLQGAVDGLHAALQVYERNGRPAIECLRVRTKLVLWASAVGSPLADRYGETTLGQLFEHAGLSLAVRLRRVLGPRLSLSVAGALRVVWRWLSPKARSGPPAAEALTQLIRVLPSLATARLFNLDDGGVRRLARFAHPLGGLRQGSLGHTTHRFVEALVSYASDRLVASRAHLVGLLATLDDASAESGQAEPGHDMRTQARLLLSVQMARQGDPAMLALAEQLEAGGTAVGLVAAQEARLIFHQMRGERERARDVRAQLEQLMISRGGGPMFEAFNQAHYGLVAGLVGDLLALKSAIESLERQAKRDPHLEGMVGLLRGSYLLASGRIEEGVSRLQTLCDDQPPWSTSYWAAARLVLARGLSLAGKQDAARSLLEALEAQLRHDVPVDEIQRVSAQWQLAVLEVARGDGAGAQARMERLVAAVQVHASPLSLGRSHELAAQATVAQGPGHRPQFHFHIGEARRLFSGSGNPLLVAQVEELAQEVLERRPFSAPPKAGARGSVAQRTLAPGARRASSGSALADAGTPQERAQLCLSIIAGRAACRAGVLYLQGAAGLTAVAATGGEADAPALSAQVRAHLDRVQRQHSDTETATEVLDPQAQHVVLDPQAQHVVHALSFTEGDGALQLVGAVALRADGTLRAPGARVLENLARELAVSGDVITAC